MKFLDSKLDPIGARASDHHCETSRRLPGASQDSQETRRSQEPLKKLSGDSWDSKELLRTPINRILPGGSEEDVVLKPMVLDAQNLETHWFYTFT